MGQDNYGYDQQGLDVQLTDQRALNGAQQLEGYTLDVRPAAGWPGLEGSATVRHRDDDIKTVADWLDTRAGQVESLPGWLKKATNVSFGPSSWHEANNLKDASGLVTDAVTKFLTETVVNMRQASGTLNGALTHYNKGEKANVDNVHRVQGALGDGGGGAPMKY